MAIAINFDKAKAERLLESLTNHKPIEAPHNVDDILALAGACFFMAMSQAPALQQAIDGSKPPPPPDPDDDEAEDTFFADLHAAIEYYGQLTMMVATGEYDEGFDPQHIAIVTVEDGEKTVVPVAGVRGDPDEDDKDE
jgi:hypothetical protein